jgi:hypothetical protein
LLLLITHKKCFRLESYGRSVTSPGRLNSEEADLAGKA